MLLDLIPARWRPFAKAIIAALLPVLSLVILGALTGSWNTTALAGAAVGALGSIGAIASAKLPTAKTLITALVGLLGLVAVGALTGEWNNAGLTGAGLAVVAALLVHETPNRRVKLPAQRERRGYD